MAEGGLNVVIGAKSNKLASDLAKAKGQFTNFSKDTKKTINDTSTVFESMGDAVGGVVGNITSGLTSLATAGGPIALVTAAVALISKAWKEAGENMDLYLKSASKIKMGTLGFNEQAQDLRKDTRKIARGGVRVDQSVMTQDFVRLGYLQGQIDKETDVNKKKILETERATVFAEYQSAKAQLEINKSTRDDLRGRQAKIDLELKFKDLLLADAKDAIEDRKLEAKWTEDQEKMIRLKTVILSKNTSIAEKEKATADFTQIASTMQKEKIADIDDDIQRTSQLLSLQGKTAELEVFILDKEQEKAEVKKQDAVYMLKEEMIQNKSAAAAERALKAEELKLKAIKDQAEALQKLKDANTKIADQIQESNQIPQSVLLTEKGIKGGGMARGGTNLTGAPDTLENIQKLTEGLNRLSPLVQGVEDSFTDMFMNIKGGFKGMVDSLIQSLEQLAMQLIAKAAIFTILNTIAPGSGMAVKSLSDLRSFVGIKGYANGTWNHPGGLSLVGERGPEWLNVPKGSQIYPNGTSPSMNNLTVSGELVGRGDNIVAIISNAKRTKNTFA